MRKIFNLADREATMEALKQLYGQGVKDDRENVDSNREPRAESASTMDQNSEQV